VAVDALPDNAAVIVPAEKLPEASRATMVEPVFALVAFDATVNVAAPAWLAVNVCEPDKPVPDTFIVNVPLLTLAAVVAVLALPFKAAVIVPALKLPDASRRTMVEAVLAVAAVMVALLACPVTEPAVVANVAVEADVAEVAVAALPLIEIPHVPVAPVPPVDGAPTVL
jgi:hypothetical protein